MKRVSTNSLGFALGVAALICALGAPTAHAQFATELSSGHFDIAATFENDALALIIGADDALPDEPEEYDPATTIYQLQSSPDASVNDEFPRSTDPGFDFLGVPAGAPVWLSAAGSNEETIAPLVGLVAEIDAGIFLNNEITLRLTGFTGTGFFSAYLPVMNGAPTPSYTTSNGIDANDVATFIAGDGHSDYVFAFTSPGLKTVTFEATGTLVGGGTRTTTNTYNFGVNYVNAPVVVPESGTLPMVLGAASVFGIGMMRRRK